MRILGLDKKRGWIRIAVTTTIDLLNIYRQIRPGDVVYQETTREVKKERASGEIDSERRSLKLGIEVENKSADPLTRRVSLRGRIVYVDQEIDVLKKYHTLHLERGSVFEVESRERLPYLLRIAESSGSGVERDVAAISVDDENIALVRISNEGLRIVKTAEWGRGAKLPGYAVREDSKAVDEVVEELKRLVEAGVRRVVVVGTSLHADEFVKEVKRRDAGLATLIRRRVTTNIGGLDGLREALRRGVLGEDLKPLADALAVERLIELATKRPEKVYMGVEEVYAACRAGQRLEVLVTEDFIWQNLDSEKLNSILDAYEKGAIGLRILLPGTEAAEKVGGLGSIVGFRSAE
jgi:protein pelota